MNDWIMDIIVAVNDDLPLGWAIGCQDDENGGLAFSARSVAGDEVGGPAMPAGYDLDIGTLGTFLREIQGELIEHAFGYAWPRCPVHGSHPLRPGGDGWRCPGEGSSRAGDLEPSRAHWDFGRISGIPVPAEPRRADGEVRWYLDDLGWGVIAHHDGDLFVHFSSIAGNGYRSLDEGRRVTFEVVPGRQGTFRRADHVQVAPRSVEH